ncbi:MAG TPA: heme-binding protein [Kofleriaceae bacterium]
MEIAKDFTFTGLPAIDAPAPPPTDVHGKQLISPLINILHLNNLGPLSGLVGSWSGTGFNQIWRPFQPGKGSDRFLELNLTDETLTVENIPGAIPNRGLLQPDMNMFGVTYLQQIKDHNLGAGLHVEPGIWAHVPATTNPSEPQSVVRMASIPHGTVINAQGIATQLTGAPVFPVINVDPFTINQPQSHSPFPEQNLSAPTQFRSSGKQMDGITQAMVTNPNSVLAAGIAGKTIKSAIQLDISTAPKSLGGTTLPGGGTANTAFLAGGPGGPNANAVTVTATFWIETIANQGLPDSMQLQYSQTVLLNFNGISWPHVTVGTLKKVG